MSQRSNQVSEELRKIVSMIFLDELSHAGLGFVTITRIDLTGDLRYARIYYSVLGDEKQVRATQAALDENMGFIKKLTVERINMKFAPEIKFELDKSIESSFKIDEILKKIKTKEGPS